MKVFIPHYLPEGKSFLREKSDGREVLLTEEAAERYFASLQTIPCPSMPEAWQSLPEIREDMVRFEQWCANDHTLNGVPTKVQDVTLEKWNIKKKLSCCYLVATPAVPSPGVLYAAKEWRNLPFEIDRIHNSEMKPDRKWMSEDSYNEALKDYEKGEVYCLFSNTYVEFDSCDCGDGYGCSHGSWPYQLRIDGVKIDFEDDGLVFENNGKAITVYDFSKITMGDFYDLCNMIGVELKLKPPFLAGHASSAQPVEFAEWANEGDWVYQRETGKWYNKYEEDPEPTTAELYKLFLNNKNK